MHGTIVEIELRDELGHGKFTWKALHGHPGRGDAHLDRAEPGDRLVVEIRSSPRGWVVERIVNRPDTLRDAPVLTRRTKRPVTANRGHKPVEPGDVLVCRFRFNTPDRHGRTSKLRPCLVMEVTHTEYRVRPIHGSNSSVRREGTGRRILNWAAVGLRKPSVVTAQDHWVDRNRTGKPIGRLAEVDRRRLLDPR